MLWVIKAIRIRTLNYYLQNNRLSQVVKDYIEMIQKRNLHDEDTREDMKSDHIKISTKIYMINFMKITRLVFQIQFISYFVS